MKGCWSSSSRSPESSSCRHKEKGKEVCKPADQVKKPLVTINQGEVYLENDKQGAKATGSYHTPDYIVKYIVRHTVIVLERKFAELEKRLREASVVTASMPGWWKPVANLLAGTNPRPSTGTAGRCGTS